MTTAAAFPLGGRVTSPNGEAFDIVAARQGDLRWLNAGNPPSLTNALPGVLGLMTILVNVIVFRGRWVVAVGPAPVTSLRTGDRLQRQVVPGRTVEASIESLASKVRDGTFTDAGPSKEGPV